MVRTAYTWDGGYVVATTMDIPAHVLFTGKARMVWIRVAKDDPYGRKGVTFLGRTLPCVGA